MCPGDNGAVWSLRTWSKPIDVNGSPLALRAIVGGFGWKRGVAHIPSATVFNLCSSTGPYRPTERAKGEPDREQGRIGREEMVGGLV